MTNSAIVHALCIGQPSSLADGKISSIDKQEVDRPIRIGRMGLEGDTQSDRKHHGGEHMAVHLYAADHYRFWRSEIPDVDRLASPGAFGENLYAEGLTEAQVYIGDRFRLGSSLLELSMGRQPCSTLERHFRRRDMVRRIIANHRCGWYFRVIEEGNAKAGDRIELIERVQTRWSVDEAFTLLFDNQRDFTLSEMRDLLSIRQLGPQWQDKLTAKLR